MPPRFGPGAAKVDKGRRPGTYSGRVVSIGDEFPSRPPWMGPSPLVVGVPLSMSGVLWRSDRAALALLGVVAYPDGLTLAIRLVERHDTLRDPAEEPWPERRVGVEYADGRVASDPDPDLPWDPWTPPPSPLLVLVGGEESGDDDFRHWQETLWLWPLPPPGPLTLVMSWRHDQHPSTRHELDGAAISTLRTWE
jgi:hypothetical protein